MSIVDYMSVCQSLCLSQPVHASVSSPVRQVPCCSSSRTVSVRLPLQSLPFEELAPLSPPGSESSSTSSSFYPSSFTSNWALSPCLLSPAHCGHELTAGSGIGSRHVLTVHCVIFSRQPAVPRNQFSEQRRLCGSAQNRSYLLIGLTSITAYI